MTSHLPQKGGSNFLYVATPLVSRLFHKNVPSYVIYYVLTKLAKNHTFNYHFKKS